ncbi:MAG TPA: hypothetical protein VMS17_25160 [Gemmataceae bacterium]|nr:hypothetical protein [Gemmataceae bacterium]
MKRTHWTTTTAVLLLTAALGRTAPVPTDKSPLAWVPASTPVVFHINGLHNLADHITAFLKNADVGGGLSADDFRRGADAFFEEGFLGHKIRGVPKDGHILIALMDLNHLDEDTPDLAVIVAVEDYKTFRDNLFNEEERKTLKAEDGYESVALNGLFPGKLCFLVDKKDHAVFTLRKERAVAFAKGGPGLDERISKSHSDRLLSSDLGLYVSMDVLNKDYGEMVKGAREALEEQLKRADEAPDRTLKPLLGPARDALGPLFQAVEASSGILVTLNLGAEGLVVHADSEFRPNSQTAELLKDFKPTAFPDLDKMRAGQIYYVGMQTSPALFKLTGTMLFSSLIDPKSPEAKGMDAAIQDMIKAGPHDRLLAVTVPPAGVEVWHFDDPEKAVAAQAKLIEATGAALAKIGVLKDKPEIQPHAEKYKGFDFTAVRLKWDVEKMVPKDAGPPMNNGSNADQLKKLLGDGLNLWFGTDGKTFVQVTGAGWNEAKEELDGYWKGEYAVGADKQFAAVRKGLPADATVVMVIDMGKYSEVLGGLMPGPAPQVPAALKGKPIYLGVAATLEPGRASLDLSLPANPGLETLGQMIEWILWRR